MSKKSEEGRAPGSASEFLFCYRFGLIDVSHAELFQYVLETFPEETNLEIFNIVERYKKLRRCNLKELRGKHRSTKCKVSNSRPVR